MKIKLFIILLLWYFVFPLYAQVIPSERIVDWTNAGFDGTRPDPELVLSLTDYGADNTGLFDNSSSVQSAIEDLNGNPGVISFPDGNYKFNESIVIPDNAILRGSSSKTTHLVFNLNGQSKHSISVSQSQSSGFIQVLSGYEKESMQLLVEDAGNFTIGGYAEIRQDNGSWDTNPAGWAEHSVGQILKIADINGNYLILENPLRISYNEALNPEIRPVIPRTNVGIECLKISRSDNISSGTGYNILFSYAANCWVSGVESSKSVCSHIYIEQSTNIEISGCYIHHAFEYNGSGTRGYGVTVNHHSGECLIENNIFEHLRHAMMVKTGANGNVFAYNYSMDPYRSEPLHAYTGDISLHGHYAYANLFEGNIVQNIIIDHYWGPSGPDNTFFRNRAELYGIIITETNSLVTSNQNFVGNEITNTGILMGNYTLRGEDHFEHGNNIKGSIQPAGTNFLFDKSYYLNDQPDFWDFDDFWPSIGIPIVINYGSNPAFDRFENSSSLTVCSDYGVFSTEETEVHDEFNIWPNPATGMFYIELLNANSETRIKVYDQYGKEFPIRPILKSDYLVQITIPGQCSSRLYFVVLINGDNHQIKKIVLY